MSDLTQSTVIIGGGFAGLFTALHLRSQNALDSIVMIDPQEQFVFKPMLYELLTGELPEDVVCPTYEELLQGSEIKFLKDRAEKIDLAKKQIELHSGTEVAYDYLVLTVGSIQGYLGTSGAKENALPLRTREQVIALKSHLQDCLQQAKQTKDDQQRQRLLTFAIVGAGPAGVEMAATLADLLPDWYAQSQGNIHEIQLILINHSQEILSGDVNAGLREIVVEAFETRTIPIKLMMGVSVKAVEGDRLEYQHNDSQETQTLFTATTIWTAGTATHPLLESLSSQIPREHLTRHGQPLVTSTLQLLDFPEVFAAGDCAEVQDNRQPALAQVAYQQGETIAHNLIALSQGKPLKSSEVKLRGTLMKLGLRNGVANLFDKIQVNHQAGHLIRNATYIELLPTPLHDVKATAEWLKEEIFDRHHRPQDMVEASWKASLTPAEKKERSLVKALAILAPIVFLIGAYWGLRTPPSEKLNPPSQPSSQSK